MMQQERYLPLPSDQLINERDFFAGWERSLITPESATARYRRAAVLTMLGNGAQSLAVLVMPSDTNNWQSSYQINKQMKTTVGSKVVGASATRNHLITTIEPVGTAARSTIDDKDWAITAFGREMKPALIYGWQQFMDLEVNPVSLLASMARVKRDAQGNLVAAPALVREQILTQAYHHPLQIFTLRSLTHVGSAALCPHTDNLAGGGFIEKKSVDSGSGKPIAEYQVTQAGLDIPDWSALYEHKRAYMTEIQSVVAELVEQGIKITTDAIVEGVGKKVDVASENTLRFYISLLVNRQLLQSKDLPPQQLSQISLTPLGVAVVENIFIPLRAWSYSPDADDRINDIRRAYLRNPSIFNSLYQQIAATYRESSKFINADPVARTLEVERLIRENPGVYNKAMLARQLGCAEGSINKTISELIADGLIISLETDIPGRVKYTSVASSENS